MVIGRRSHDDTDERYSSVYIDELTLWNYQLSEQQIDQLHFCTD